MRCNNISLNNSQGHPGKEGPNGEKGHMVSFFFYFYLPLFTSLQILELRISNVFQLRYVFVLLQTHLHKAFCINGDNSSAAGACVCVCVCVCVCTVIACVLQNSHQTFISPGPRWPSRTHRLSWTPRREGEMIINH